INCVHWTVVHGDVGGPMDSIWVRHHPPSNHRIILPQLKMIPPRFFILLCKLSLVAVAVQGFIGFGDAEFFAPHAVVCGLYHQRLHVCYRQVVEPACAKATASRPHYGGFALVTDPDPSSPARPTHSRLPMPLTESDRTETLRRKYSPTALEPSGMPNFWEDCRRQTTGEPTRSHLP